MIRSLEPADPRGKTESMYSTFERSCQHWSEAGREEMDAFYRLAQIDYDLLAGRLDWASVLQSMVKRFGGSIPLLDVACGSGQFPAALLRAGVLPPRDVRIIVDLLDPSDFSIRTAKSKLRPPLVAGRDLCCTAQAMPSPREPYAAAWATHAIYCVPSAELDDAIGPMISAVDPDGLGFIAHAQPVSHYITFQRHHLNGRGAGCEPFCDGDQVFESVSKFVGAAPLATTTLDYEGTVSIDDTPTVEKYLQRCLFDDTLSLEGMLADPHTGPYLRGCRDEAAGLWRFSQRVRLIGWGVFGKQLLAPLLDSAAERTT